jgi:hypothetical protein
MPTARQPLLQSCIRVRCSGTWQAAKHKHADLQLCSNLALQLLQFLRCKGLGDLHRACVVWVVAHVQSVGGKQAVAAVTLCRIVAMAYTSSDRRALSLAERCHHLPPAATLLTCTSFSTALSGLPGTPAPPPSAACTVRGNKQSAHTASTTHTRLPCYCRNLLLAVLSQTAGNQPPSSHKQPPAS